MTDIIKICAVVSITAMLSLLLKGQDNGIGHLISVTGTVITGIIAVNALLPILDLTKDLGSFTPQILDILIRVLGISYLTDFSASICKDMKETSLAAGIEICGKAEILIISLPLFTKLMELCTDLISQ